MSKRNSNFSLQTQLRMLMRLIPARDGHGFRAAVAVRLEADERTGEIFPRGARSPRQHLQDVTGISRDATFNAAMSTVRKLGLFQGKRVYSRGERQKGGDRLELNWDQWEEACFSLSAPQPEACFSETENQQISDSESQHIAESESQHYKDTATVTAKYTAIEPNNVGLKSSTPAGLASDSLNLESQEGVELQLQEPEVVETSEGIPWVEPTKIPSTYAQAVWFDRAIGKLFLVLNAKGRAYYHSLRDEPYDPEVIRLGLSNAGAAAGRSRQAARAGALEALVRTYCGYALEKLSSAQQASRARETAFQRPRQFQP